MMEITLITEGTYPHHLGGVSVWCDQLLTKLTSTVSTSWPSVARRRERKMYVPPPNVARVGTVPLWAHAPRRKARPRTE